MQKQVEELVPSIYQGNFSTGKPCNISQVVDLCDSNRFEVSLTNSTAEKLQVYYC